MLMFETVNSFLLFDMFKTYLQSGFDCSLISSKMNWLFVWHQLKSFKLSRFDRLTNIDNFYWISHMDYFPSKFGLINVNLKLFSKPVQNYKTGFKIVIIQNCQNPAWNYKSPDYPKFWSKWGVIKRASNKEKICSVTRDIYHWHWDKNNLQSNQWLFYWGFPFCQRILLVDWIARNKIIPGCFSSILTIRKGIFNCSVVI